MAEGKGKDDQGDPGFEEGGGHLKKQSGSWAATLFWMT